MTLDQEIRQRMLQAPRRMMDTEPQEDGPSEVWHWLNNPTMQSQGIKSESGIEKEIGR